MKYYLINMLFCWAFKPILLWKQQEVLIFLTEWIFIYLILELILMIIKTWIDRRK